MNLRRIKILRWLLPLVVLLLGVLAVTAMGWLKRDPVQEETERPLPVVTTAWVDTGSVPVRVESFGNVRAQRQSLLGSKVSGRVEWVSTRFHEGAALLQGEALIQLDEVPLRSALAEAEARLAAAELALAQEIALARQAQEDWQRLEGGPADPLVLRQPQLARAKAEQAAARAAVVYANSQLEHATIRAPFAGRVAEKLVELGQVVTAGATVVARLLGEDPLEVVLTLSLDDWVLLGADGAGLQEVELFALQGGLEHSWKGIFERTGAELEPRNRLLRLIVRVQAPAISEHGLALQPGMFVRAILKGRNLEGAFLIPAAALQNQQQVFVVTEAGRLRSVPVTVLQRQRAGILVQGQLSPGDRLVTTPLLTFVEGMAVAALEPQDPTPVARP